MNIHLELAKMVCMGWAPKFPGGISFLLQNYLNGYTLNEAEKMLLKEGIDRLEAGTVLPQNIVQPNSVSHPVKRRGCPPGGWPKKDKPVEHD